MNELSANAKHLLRYIVAKALKQTDIVYKPDVTIILEEVGLSAEEVAVAHEELRKANFTQ
ncbi:MAG: hypothetical protein MN733_42240 [Nitrososphaera sp.]|nr:hypothetical protein [Nitrososphaera sp.]